MERRSSNREDNIIKPMAISFSEEVNGGRLSANSLEEVALSEIGKINQDIDLQDSQEHYLANKKYSLLSKPTSRREFSLHQSQQLKEMQKSFRKSSIESCDSCDIEESKEGNVGVIKSMQRKQAFKHKSLSNSDLEKKISSKSFSDSQESEVRYNDTHKNVVSEEGDLVTTGFDFVEEDSD